MSEAAAGWVSAWEGKESWNRGMLEDWSVVKVGGGGFGVREQEQEQVQVSGGWGGTKFLLFNIAASLKVPTAFRDFALRTGSAFNQLNPQS